MKLKQYNFGCGASKLKDCINVDVNEDLKPDLVMNITEFPYPISDYSVDRIYFLHTIEHVQALKHFAVLKEFHRILKLHRELIIAYPEFEACATNYIDNVSGKKEFWKHTLYGRQLYPSDFHVSLMDSREFKQLLNSVGFKIISMKPEVDEPYNTIVIAKKVKTRPTYEDILNKEVFGENHGSTSTDK